MKCLFIVLFLFGCGSRDYEKEDEYHKTHPDWYRTCCVCTAADKSCDCPDKSKCPPCGPKTDGTNDCPSPEQQPGPQGNQGPQGPTGNAGPAGPSGKDGAPGRDGYDGRDGRDAPIVWPTTPATSDNGTPASGIIIVNNSSSSSSSSSNSTSSSCSNGVCSSSSDR